MGDTRAEIRSATMGMSRFGYQPTAEQVLAGNVGMDHPTRQIDNTDQETSGTAANDAARAVPSILTAILGNFCISLMVRGPVAYIFYGMCLCKYF